MTAALPCCARVSPVHKVSRLLRDHGQIEDRAHAQRHAWEKSQRLKMAPKDVVHGSRDRAR